MPNSDGMAEGSPRVQKTRAVLDTAFVDMAGSLRGSIGRVTPPRKLSSLARQTVSRPDTMSGRLRVLNCG